MKNRRDVIKTALAGGAAATASPIAAEAAAPGMVLPAPPVVSVPINGSRERFPVRRIYCVGRNYLEHIRELGNDEREPPFFFAKHRDMIVQNGGTCAYPTLTNDYQHEIELVIAMKSGGMNIPVDQALNHVYGYAVGLDMTRRDQQNLMKAKQLPWEISKSFDQSAPIGAIYPVNQVGHMQKGRIHLTVNGKTTQDSDLEKMIWNVPEIIHHLSRQVELAAGDLIYTGTPEGVGPLKKGDKMVAAVDKLGRLDITVV